MVKLKYGDGSSELVLLIQPYKFGFESCKNNSMAFLVPKRLRNRFKCDVIKNINMLMSLLNTFTAEA